jgi:predicted TIM-barrel fold metal-dependent hydrolase
MTMQTTELYKRIRVEIESIPLLDTHEHLMSEEARLATKIDLFYWFSHYASCDLVSAGMSQQTLERLRDADRPLDERWAEFVPFWEHARTTAYGRALLLAAHDLFEIDDINEATYGELSQKISASNSRGWYDHVLKERANIELAILDPLEDVDPTPLEGINRRLFAPVLRVDGLIVPCNRIELRTLETKTGVAIHSLDDLLTAMDLTFERAVAAGVVGIKVGLAYQRSLHFDKVAKADAERVFNRLSRYPAKPLQDYLLHQAIRRAIEHHLPIQIHTGLQEGNGNLVSNANPLHLVNLLLEYEEARFDLFHAGYPYQSEMATLGKNFANVYVDLCWVHVISPWVARQTLHEWIETIPANKIFAFGGDYIFVEGTYAHSRMARDDVAEVLAEKVELGYLTEDEAIAVAQKLLRDNAVQFFRLPV